MTTTGMPVSELITRLRQLQVMHGDVHVSFQYDSGYGSENEEINEDICDVVYQEDINEIVIL